VDVLDLHAGAPPAPGTVVDVVVARDWEATAWLWDVEARRRVYAVDHFAHEALGPWQAERIAAALSYDLPVDFLAFGAHVAARLRELRPEARVEELRPGVDKTAWQPLAAAATAGPLRVAVHGEDHGVLARMAEPVERVDDLRQAHVLLSLEAHLPVDGPALHAVHCGVVPVLLPTAPAAELVDHRRTGILAEPDDSLGTARWLDTLARRADLRSELAANALELASSWPSVADARAAEAAALARLLAADPAPTDRWGQRVMADALAAVAVWRNEHYKLAGELQRIERDEAFQAAQRARDAWRGDPRLAAVRKVTAPLVRRAKKRVL
jgi:hypothetical protein